MELAVGEVLANISEHAYDAGGGAVSIKAFRAAGMLTVTVSDDGRATVAPSVPRGLPPPTGYRGRGLYMVGRLMDDVTISVNPAGHGLTVSMTKRVKDRDLPKET
jgi:anti-sigma regulatory factor (Ser/Thr protein kinase)